MAELTQETAIWLLVAIAFLPPILYVIYIRNQERFNREPWRALFLAFFFGAILSIVISLLLTLVVAQQFGNFVREYQIVDPEGELVTWEFLIIIIAAPVVEEFAKGLSLLSVRRRIDEVEDGIIYGAAAGLGFSATENLLYELAALTEDSQMNAIVLGILRSLTSSFLHATASGILGYGIARRLVHGGTILEVLPYYAMAVLLHSGFNALAYFAFEWSAFLIFFVSFAAIKWTIDRIRTLDRGHLPPNLV